MRFIWLCLLLATAWPSTGCQWRGERSSNTKPIAEAPAEQKAKPVSPYSDAFIAYEKSILDTLNEHRVIFTIEENPRLQAGIAKFLLAKIIRSDSGLIIVIGTPTDWEGAVPQSGTEFMENGKPIGIRVNNFDRQDAPESLYCFFTYGKIDDATKTALLKTIRRIE